MPGKPVSRNALVPVEFVLRKLSEDAAIADLLDAYARVTEADIRACLAYAADMVAHGELRLQGSS